jgi:hypothetical protein
LHNGFYELIDGEHKVKACKELGYSDIPDDMIEIKNIDEKEALLKLGKMKTRGSEIEPFKEAEYIDRLHQLAMTFEDIGKKLGYSKTRVINIHRRLKIPTSIRTQIEGSPANLFSTSILDEIASLHTFKAMHTVVDWCLLQPRSKQEVREYIKSIQIQNLDIEPANFRMRVANDVYEAMKELASKPYKSHPVTIEITPEIARRIFPTHPISTRRLAEEIFDTLGREWLKKEGYLPLKKDKKKNL